MFSLMKEPLNISLRLQQLEYEPGPLATKVNRYRRFYESLPPTEYEVSDVQGTVAYLCRFTPDGQFLVGFTHHMTQLVVFRFTGMRCCLPGEAVLMPREAMHQFSSYFRQLFCLLLTENEKICKHFCLVVGGGRFLLLASWTLPQNGPRSQHDRIPVPILDSITLHLVRLPDGKRTDTHTFCSDYIHLAHECSGVFVSHGLLVVTRRSTSFRLRRRAHWSTLGRLGGTAMRMMS
uniref:Light-mediated development protein det1 n=1 Tax=Tetraselmis sp. GSL018 TaxID=582737 RepID=A0A061QVQ0_9CHLO